MCSVFLEAIQSGFQRSELMRREIYENWLVKSYGKFRFLWYECISGNNVLNENKGCKFQHKKCTNRQANLLGEKGEKFKQLADNTLVVSTPRSHDTTYNAMGKLISNDSIAEMRNLVYWLAWCDDDQCNIFLSFIGYNCSRNNQAEVIHAI